MGLLSRRRRRLISALVLSCCVENTPKKPCITCMATFHTCLTMRTIWLFIFFF